MSKRLVHSERRTTGSEPIIRLRLYAGRCALIFLPPPFTAKLFARYKNQIFLEALSNLYLPAGCGRTSAELKAYLSYMPGTCNFSVHQPPAVTITIYGYVLMTCCGRHCAAVISYWWPPPDFGGLWWTLIMYVGAPYHPVCIAAVQC